MFSYFTQNYFYNCKLFRIIDNSVLYIKTMLGLQKMLSDRYLGEGSEQNYVGYENLLAKIR